jgi:hypothetical protein
MLKSPSAVTVLAVLLVAIAVASGTAGALSVSVAESDEDITIEVTEGGDPVPNANVTVSGVTSETSLDGEYVTDREGRVSFGDRTSDLSGVVHLRISVDSGDSFKSVLTTFARGPDSSSTPIGHRMSMSLQEPVASTHGKVVSRLDSGGVSNVRATAQNINSLLANLSDTQLRREVLGRDLAAGEISTSEFYVGAVKNARRGATLRGALEQEVERLSRYSDERLRDEGVDVEEFEALREEVGTGRSINTDRRLMEEG